MNNKIIFTTGMALFAMFFGAGNLIYPLELGATAGNQIGYVMLAFMVSGIGLPLLGLFATSMYQGNYWDFFSRLGKIPAFLVITFLILIVGPLFATPRTEVVTFQTLKPFLPAFLDNAYLFSALYCGIIFSLTYSHTKIVDIIGRVLSPIKILLFTVLIVAGFVGTQAIQPNNTPILTSMRVGLIDGYSTMDMIAAFFFCTVVYRNIASKLTVNGKTDIQAVIKIFFKSCIVAGILLALVYGGFMLLALFHASAVQGVETAQLIVATSNAVLGRFGSFFVALCVSVACIVTATALVDVTTTFFHEHVMQRKVPRLVCLFSTLTIVYCMSILGFATIMNIASPILEILYPALIVYCVINIALKLYSLNKKPLLEVTEINSPRANGNVHELL